MDEAEIQLSIFSPRWGHEDVYTVKLTREAMTIRTMPRTARCEWRENLDPIWVGESIMSILSNDMIYAPKILPDLLEYAWRKWREGQLDNAGVAAELQALADWQNQITGHKPKSDFWNTYF
jgi:hypothetical protein